MYARIPRFISDLEQLTDKINLKRLVIEKVDYNIGIFSE